MKLFSKIGSTLILLAFLCLLPVITQAQFQQDLTNDFSNSLNQAASKASYPSSQASENYINTKLGLLITLFFVGVIFLILIIYSGIQWMTASGNEEKVEASKKRIINATIGMIVVFSAYIITTFVYNYFDAKFLTAPTGSTQQATNPNNTPQNDAECAKIDVNKPKFFITDGTCVECLINDDCNGFWNLNICNQNNQCEKRF